MQHSHLFDPAIFRLTGIYWIEFPSLTEKIQEKVSLFLTSVCFLGNSLTVFCWDKEDRSSKYTLFRPLSILLNYMYHILQCLHSKIRVLDFFPRRIFPGPSPSPSVFPEPPSLSIAFPETRWPVLQTAECWYWWRRSFTLLTFLPHPGLADPNIFSALFWKHLPVEQRFYLNRDAQGSFSIWYR